MKKVLVFIFILVSLRSLSQEFAAKSYSINLELLQGFIKPKLSPELYLADLRLSYQTTVVPGVLRIGAAGGGMYTNSDFSAYIGPDLSLLIKPLKLGAMGTAANLHLLLEHFWGTDHQKLFGGGLRASIGNELLLSLTTHRDYEFKYWNFQVGVGYNFHHDKIPAQPVIR